MFALVLRHKANVGAAPLGVLIIHETNAPVLVGDTPMSQILLDKYAKGFKVVVYDRSFNKRKEKVVPPKDLDAFMAIGVGYFAQANMALEKRAYTDEDETRVIEVDGAFYRLREI